METEDNSDGAQRARPDFHRGNPRVFHPQHSLLARVRKALTHGKPTRRPRRSWSADLPLRRHAET